MCVALVVVGGVAAGFLVKEDPGKARAREGGVAAEERSGPPGGPLKAIPLNQLKVTQVEDPGDPYEDGTAQDPPAGAAPGAPAAGNGAADGAAAAEGAGDRGRLRPAPFKENPAALSKVDQGGENIEPEALYYLMHRAVTVDPAALHKEVTELTWRRLQREAADITGKPVRFTGTLARTKIETFSPDPIVNPSRVTSPVWGLVVNSGFKPCHFFAPELPPNIKSKDTVELEGYFLKVYQYFDGQGRRREAPVLVVRNITFVPPWEPEPIVWFGVPLQMGGHTFTVLELIIAGVALFTLPAAFIYGRVERKNYLAFRQKTLERRRAKLAGDKQAAPAPPESPPPGGGEAAAPAGSAAAAMMGVTTPEAASADAPVADAGAAPAGPAADPPPSPEAPPPENPAPPAEGSPPAE
ncbi:MAG: hypothetical protein ACYTGX_10945 [Planctomycetota bacterium]